MAYLLAWLIYLLMAVLLVLGFERYLAPLIHQHQWHIFMRALVLIVLFTPGLAGTESVFVVPAMVGVVFNILAHSGLGFIRASLPVLLVSSVVFTVLYFKGLSKSRPLEGRF